MYEIDPVRLCEDMYLFDILLDNWLSTAQRAQGYIHQGPMHVNGDSF